MNTPVLIRDTNGNTVGRCELDELADEQGSIEAHFSDSGTIIVTIELNDDES